MIVLFGFCGWDEWIRNWEKIPQKCAVLVCDSVIRTEMSDDNALA